MEQTSGGMEFDREDVTFKLNPDEVVTFGFNTKFRKRPEKKISKANKVICFMVRTVYRGLLGWQTIPLVKK